MRAKVTLHNTGCPDTIYYGDFLGLLQDEDEDNESVLAIVRLDGYGLYLRSFHPSCVEIEPTEPTKANESIYDMMKFMYNGMTF